MRIAAGVLLIIAAIMNVVAGAGYVLGGAAAGVAAVAGDEALKQAAAQGGDVDKATAAEAAKAVDTAKNAGAGLGLFGLFLWAMFVLQIVAAILLFMAKAKGFNFVVGGLSIVAEVVGIVIISFGWTNIFGLLGGVFAILGAKSIGEAAKPAAAPAQA